MDEEYATIYMDYTPPRKIKRLILALARIGGEFYYSMRGRGRDMEIALYARVPKRKKRLAEAIIKKLTRIAEGKMFYPPDGETLLALAPPEKQIIIGVGRDGDPIGIREDVKTIVVGPEKLVMMLYGIMALQMEKATLIAGYTTGYTIGKATTKIPIPTRKSLRRLAERIAMAYGIENIEDIEEAIMTRLRKRMVPMEGEIADAAEALNQMGFTTARPIENYVTYHIGYVPDELRTIIAVHIAEVCGKTMIYGIPEDFLRMIDRRKKYIYHPLKFLTMEEIENMAPDVEQVLFVRRNVIRACIPVGEPINTQAWVEAKPLWLPRRRI